MLWSVYMFARMNGLVIPVSVKCLHGSILSGELKPDPWAIYNFHDASLKYLRDSPCVLYNDVVISPKAFHTLSGRKHCWSKCVSLGNVLVCTLNKNGVKLKYCDYSDLMRFLDQVKVMLPPDVNFNLLRGHLIIRRAPMRRVNIAVVAADYDDEEDQ